MLQITPTNACDDPKNDPMSAMNESPTGGRWQWICLATMLCLCLPAMSVPVNLVLNGSFEQPGTGGPADWQWSPSVSVITGDSSAADGQNFAEVNGSLSQNIQTVPGQEYQLQFALSGNYNISQATIMDVWLNGVEMGAFAWHPAGNSYTDLGWLWSDVYFVAATSSSSLMFVNEYGGDGSGRVPNLDAVSIVQTPDAAPTIGLLGLALGALLIFHRRLNGPTRSHGKISVSIRG
jgi:hypothetical protein